MHFFFEGGTNIWGGGGVLVTYTVLLNELSLVPRYYCIHRVLCVSLRYSGPVYDYELTLRVRSPEMTPPSLLQFQFRALVIISDLKGLLYLLVFALYSTVLVPYVLYSVRIQLAQNYITHYGTLVNTHTECYSSSGCLSVYERLSVYANSHTFPPKRRKRLLNGKSP